MGGGTLSRMGMREFGYSGEVYAKSQTWMICKVDSLSGAGRNSDGTGAGKRRMNDHDAGNFR